MGFLVAIVRPYKKTFMNVSDMLIFANMALVDILLGGGLDYYYHSSLFWIVVSTLTYIPLLVLTVAIAFIIIKEIIVLPKEYRCREITTNEFGL